jgi:hypothetical protein
MGNQIFTAHISHPCKEDNQMCVEGSRFRSKQPTPWPRQEVFELLKQTLGHPFVLSCYRRDKSTGLVDFDTIEKLELKSGQQESNPSYLHVKFKL